MNENIIEIGGINLNYLDVKKYWVDSESPEEKAIKDKHQDNNYLAGFLSILVAGLISAYMSRMKGNSPQKKYLHIKTNQNTTYCFSEDEIDIKDALLKLKQ